MPSLIRSGNNSGGTIQSGGSAQGGNGGSGSATAGGGGNGPSSGTGGRGGTSTGGTVTGGNGGGASGYSQGGKHEFLTFEHNSLGKVMLEVTVKLLHQLVTDLVSTKHHWLHLKHQQVAPQLEAMVDMVVQDLPHLKEVTLVEEPRL